MFAAVESDVVGYTTIQMDAGKWYQVGCPFVDLDNRENIPLNEIFSSGFSQGDTLCTFDPSTSRYTNSLYWVTAKEAWCDLPIPAVATPTSAMLSAGQAVYIHKSVAGTVVLSGKVEAKEVVFGSEGAPTWAQVSPVWPEEKRINEFRWKGLKHGDTLTIFDSETGRYGESAYWLESANAWCNLPIPGVGTPVSFSVTPGQAVYINKATGGQASVVAPQRTSAN